MTERADKPVAALADRFRNFIGDRPVPLVDEPAERVFAVRSSTIESLRQERSTSQMIERRSHLLQNGLGGRIGGAVAHLVGIVAQVKKRLVKTFLLADIRPLAVLDGPQRGALLGQTPVISLARVIRNDLRQRRARSRSIG